MAKRKSQPKKVEDTKPQTTEAQAPVKRVTPKFKSRFGGLVKVDPTALPAEAREKVIEGQVYIEFAGLTGVYFSEKLFV